MKNKFKSKMLAYPEIYSMLRKVFFITEEIKIYIRFVISAPFLVLPIKNNKIVICSYFGKGYGDNGKYIVEEIIKQGLNYDIVWMLKSNLIRKSELPKEVRVVKYGSLKALYEMSTSKIWIDNSRKKFYPLKRKKQYYIQTWHASMGIKKIEKDAEKSLSTLYVKTAKKDSQLCDLMISGSEFRYNLYRNSFWYKGEILRSGIPRCDLFFNNNDKLKEKVYKQLKIPINKKVILYAPTFRENVDLEFISMNFEAVLTALKDRFSGDWVFLIRLHPNIAHLSDEIEYSSDMLNASNYSDMQELLAISEVLITDYSSSMFDMAVQKKICFIYAPDIEIYLNNDRGLYFDYEELPFKVAETTEELMINIQNFCTEEYNRELNRFNNIIDNFEDGKASERILDRIQVLCQQKGNCK